MDYYFFDEYGECVAERFFATEDEACAYAEQIGVDFFCTDED